jgi:copper(I)-binding protein
LKTWINVFGSVAIAVAVVVAGAACGGDNGGTKTAAVTPVASKPAATPTAATAKTISIEGAWARKSPAGQPTMMAGQTATMAGQPTVMAGDRGAAYMVIKNSGSADDALISAESTIANTTEVHESVMSGDVVTMRPVARIDVKAGGSVELKPGGYHIMFIGLKQPLQAGTKVAVTLKFEKAGSVQVEAEVRDQ